MQYDIHTNKTTPYWNCPTRVLKSKVELINFIIRLIHELPGDSLDFTIATQIVDMLKELRRCVKNQIEYREEN